MIIGLTGFARSGKDSVAKVLVDQYGFTRIAFADPIREMLLQIDPILDTGHHLSSTLKEYGWELAKARPEVRRLLQELGVSARAIINEDVWVNKALSIIDKDIDYVFTDVRFINEVAALRLAGAHIWRVERPGVTAINGHVSESYVSTFEVDQTFVNEGSLGDLEAAVKARMVGLLV